MRLTYVHSATLDILEPALLCGIPPGISRAEDFGL